MTQYELKKKDIIRAFLILMLFLLLVMSLIINEFVFFIHQDTNEIKQKIEKIEKQIIKQKNL